MFKVILIEIAIFILFLNSILNYFIFPNFLSVDFTNQTLIMELFSNISIILASIFGMVIAIFLVSFQIFKKNYVSYSVRDFFKDANISLLFVIYLSTIFISYISLIFITKDYNLDIISNLFYLSLFLFVISILFLYFIIKSILTSRYSNNKVKEVISRLNYDDIKNYSKKYSDDLILPKNYSNINKYPHLFLEEMIINTVKRRDEFAIKEYFEELRCKIYELTDSHKSIEERNNIFYFFRNLFVKASQIAIKEKEKTILLTILNSIFPIYMHCLNRDITGESIKELDITLAEILILTVGPDDLLPIRFPIYLKGIRNNIIRLLKKQKNYVENYPEKRLMNILHKLIDRAMTVGAESSVRDILKSFSDILYEVIDTADINKMKRIEIVYKICFYYKKYLLKSVDKGFWDIEVLEYSFNSEKLLKAVKTEADFGKQVLMLYCEILLELINRDILDEFSIENITKIGENIILNEEINTKYSNEAILYIFNIMLKMEKKLETKPDIIIDRHNVLVKQADKLKNLIEENPPKFTRIKNELSKIMPMLTGNKIIGNESINWPDLN